MPNAYSALYTHLVFSTKHRAPTIRADIRPRLFEYIGGICRNISCAHAHLLVRRHPSKCESEIMRDIKANSSRWLKELTEWSGWQDGGGAFSVGPQDLASVREYFAKQEEHHRKETFQEEYLRFLKKYEVEFDPRYVFE